MYAIKLDFQLALDALQQVQDAGLDLEPVLKNIGEMLINSTKERFRTSTGPDGQRWADKQDTTHDPRPLIGETKSLSRQIHWQLVNGDLLVGSTMEYAGTQQFGAIAGQYGKTVKGAALPFGDITARPFIGLSVEDEQSIVEFITHYIEKKAGTAE